VNERASWYVDFDHVKRYLEHVEVNIRKSVSRMKKKILQKILFSQEVDIGNIIHMLTGKGMKLNRRIYWWGSNRNIHQS
jgi:hypothetical protein